MLDLSLPRNTHICTDHIIHKSSIPKVKLLNGNIFFIKVFHLFINNTKYYSFLLILTNMPCPLKINLLIAFSISPPGTSRPMGQVRPWPDLSLHPSDATDHHYATLVYNGGFPGESGAAGFILHPGLLTDSIRQLSCDAGT